MLRLTFFDPTLLPRNFSMASAEALEYFELYHNKRDEYQIGDMVVYCEIDSWIPTEIAPFLTKGKTPKEYLGVKGERLKTIKLRML